MAGIVLGALYSNPMGLLVFSAFVNGVAAAPFLVVTMLISSDTAIMGNNRNGKLASIMGWFATVAMTICGVAGIWQPPARAVPGCSPVVTRTALRGTRPVRTMTVALQAEAKAQQKLAKKT